MSTVNFLSSSRNREQWASSNGLAIAVVAIVALLSTIYRNHLLFIDPQMMSEDVFVYFNEDRLLGAPALIAPYSGYLQLCCRIIAFVVGFAPARYAAELYAAIFIGVIIVTTAVIYTSPIFTGWGKVLAALALTCSPTGSEVFFGMLYSQWILAPTVALALYESPTRRGRMAVLLSCFAIVGLSSPFGILAAPFAIWKAITERTRYAYILLATTAVVTAAQIPGVIARSAGNPSAGSAIERAFGASSILYSWLTGRNYPGMLVAMVVSVPTFCLLAWYVWRNRRVAYKPLVYFVAYGMAALIPGCLWVDANLHPNQFLFGARYFYPAVVWCMLAFIVIEQNSGRKAVTFPIIAVAALAMCVAHARPISVHLTNRNWKQLATCIETSANCVALMNPHNTGYIRVPSDSELNTMTHDERVKFLASQRWM